MKVNKRNELVYQNTDAVKSHPPNGRSRLGENSIRSCSGWTSGIMSNSLCKSSPSNAPPCITAVEKGDADEVSVTWRSGEKTSKGRDEVGDEAEGAMISRRSSSIALSLIDFVIESSAIVVVAEDEGVMLSSVI